MKKPEPEGLAFTKQVNARLTREQYLELARRAQANKRTVNAEVGVIMARALAPREKP